MGDIDKLNNLVLSAVDEVNELLPKDQKLEKSLDTGLFGAAANIESLTIINLIVAVEEKFENEFNKTMNLSEKVFFIENPPQTLGTLSEYILDIMGEE